MRGRNFPTCINPFRKRCLVRPLFLLILYNTVHDQVPGYGRELALPFMNVLDEAEQQAFHAEFPPNSDASLIGETPPDFEPNHFGYSHLDILRLIVFYNDTFGIVPEDDLAGRKHKFFVFLSEF